MSWSCCLLLLSRHQKSFYLLLLSRGLLQGKAEGRTAEYSLLLFHKSQQAPLGDELQLLPPIADQVLIVLLPPGFEQEIAEEGGRG